jgi:RND family efflux transporter MFP subunit
MSEYKKPSAWLRIILCLLILAAGIGGLLVLKKMKKPPRQVEASERPLPVRVTRVRAEQVPIVISGFGEVRSRRTVPLSAEVAGRILETYKGIQAGTVVRRGEVLCRINDEDYRIALESASARFKSLSRDLELARKEFARVSGLYEKNKVGTLSSVEKAERSVNSIVNQRSQVKQAMEAARLSIQRCTIRAPFTGRVAELNMEEGEYVTPGRKLCTLVDDSDLEVLVPLDSHDAVRWLRFKPAAEANGWFGLPEQTDCRVSWSEQLDVQAAGTLDRVVRFDPTSRTLVVAVRIERNTESGLPIVPGMFCRVDISGRLLDQVFVLPRQAVTFEGIVYTVQDNRLHSRRVEAAREQDSKVLVTGGLKNGDIVITTRLENPLENTLVRIEESGNGAQ